MSIPDRHDLYLSRRVILRHGTLLLAAPAFNPSQCLSDELHAETRVGMVTDLHYADKVAAGSRHYRETLPKLTEATLQFEKDKVDLVVELGDFIDAADSVDTELRYLKAVNDQFSKVSSDRHYVLGNHCVDTLTKEEFLDGVERPKSYYSFDRGQTHFVILDACFKSDGQPYGRRNFEWTDANIPPAELEWLKADLEATAKPVVVFTHQRLDVSNNHGVRNCPEVRHVLESSGKVLAVFQGHSHQNDLRDIAGIHYCTLVAMVEGSGAANNGFSVMTIFADGGIRVSGFRKQNPYDW